MPTKKATLLALSAISIAMAVLVACGSNSGTIQGGPTGFTNSNLKGTYTFVAAGSDIFGNQPDKYEVGGVLVADGSGNITGGEQTYSNTLGGIGDSFTGSYSLGADGLGTITLNTGDAAIGVGGTETLSVAILSPSSGLISQFDTSATSSGTLDLQTSTAMPTGGYAFSVLGARVIQNGVMAFGGVFNIDNNPSAGSISGAGSVFDIAQPGAVALDGLLTGSVSTPDSMGKVTVQLSGGINGFAISFDGYVTNATHLQLVENDAFATSAATAIGQGVSTGSFTAASFSGPYVFGFTGYNFSGYGADAGVITSDGGGNLPSGQIDQDQGGGVISDTLSGSYVSDVSGTGRVEATTTFVTRSIAGPTMVFYLTGAGNPIPVLQVDATARSAGVAYAQSSGTPSFSGTYGIGYGGSSFAGDAGVTGVITASGGSFSGSANDNVKFVPVANKSISGGFSSGNFGSFTGTVSTNSTTATCSFYFIDSTRAIVIQTDGNLAMLGNIRQQAAP